MLKVLIADDHPIVREGLKRLIQDEFPSAVVEEAEKGQDVLDKLRAPDWDLVILDINLPDKSGLEVLKEARALREILPIIMLSVYPEEQYAVRALKAGANAYLTKNLAPYELIKAVHAVRSGQKHVSAAIAQQLIKSQGHNQPIMAHSTLSDRELEVLCLFASGKTSKEIGSILTISEKTVSTYRSRMLMKLQLHTTVDLIRYALDHRIAE